jgi:hypothetical protein
MSQFGAVAAVAAFGGVAFLSWRQKVFAATQTSKEYEVRAFRPQCASRGESRLMPSPVAAVTGASFWPAVPADRHG